MPTAHAIEPTPEQLAELAAHRPDGPIVALNLNRYRERAAYPPGTPEAEVSGQEAYLRYGIVALQAMAAQRWIPELNACSGRPPAPVNPIDT